MTTKRPRETREVAGRTEQRCSGPCREWLPLDDEHFQRVYSPWARRYVLSARCRSCKTAALLRGKRARDARVAEERRHEILCRSCGKKKPADARHFPLVRGQRFRSPCNTCKRIITGEWRKTRRGRASVIRYARSQKHKTASQRYMARNGKRVRAAWDAAHAAELRAHERVKYAVKHGKLPRPEKCERCRKPRRRLLVMCDPNDAVGTAKFYCPPCHAAVRRGGRYEEEKLERKEDRLEEKREEIRQGRRATARLATSVRDLAANLRPRKLLGEDMAAIHAENVQNLEPLKPSEEAWKQSALTREEILATPWVAEQLEVMRRRMYG